MMVSFRDQELYRRDVRSGGAVFAQLSTADRERLVKPYLPDPQSLSQPSRRHKSNGSRKRPHHRQHRTRAKPVRTFLKSQLYLLVYSCIHIFFGLYVRLRQALWAIVDRIQAIIYYHHRTPELIQKDVKGLARLPEHLSIILSLRSDEDALETLMDEVAELVAWSSCAEIPTLSIYEKNGILKSCIPTLYQVVTDKLSSYYGSPSHQPPLLIFAPHHSVYCPSPFSSTARRSNTATPVTLLLLSAPDGRETLVDLTKTLTEMSQNGKLSPADISTDLIDAEISEITSRPSQSTPALINLDSHPSSNGVAAGDTQVSADAHHGENIIPRVKPEPDLLLIFGPYVKLDGYPPWQIRLTEIFCTGNRSGSSLTGGQEAVEYQGFLRGLWRYARAQMRFGR